LKRRRDETTSPRGKKETEGALHYEGEKLIKFNEALQVPPAKEVDTGLSAET